MRFERFQPSAALKPPIVRLQAKTGIELGLSTGSQIATIIVGLAVFFAAVDLAQVILAPVALAVVTGLMFSPVATVMERRLRLPLWASALAIVLLLLVMIAIVSALFAFPLSLWLDRLPDIWVQIQSHIRDWRQTFDSLAGLQEQLRSVMGTDEAMTVNIEEGSAVTEIAFVAPIIAAQVLLFLASLYFFIATRHQIRHSILALCITRRARLKTAHVFRDVEWFVSRYLLSISLINAGLGVAVGLALWAAGVPSPFLWGMLAFLLNYIIYIGPAIMSVILIGVGLATWNELSLVFLPVTIYLAINFIEAQFVTPHVIGRAMTLNPFFVLLSLTFWIWLWGPSGGFVAIPFILTVHAVMRNVVPQHKA